MEIVLIVLALPAFVLAGRFFIVPAISPTPDGLGVRDGQLKPCPPTPNCVSSQAPADDREHRVEPLPLNGTLDEARARLVAIVRDMPRSQVVTERDDYLHVTFRSLLWGFIDDTEFYFDASAGVIHVRSSARLGRGDMGVNRQRVSDIRAQYTG